MAHSAASIYEFDFYQPQEVSTRTLKLIGAMLKQVVATLDAHVELLHQEHRAADQLRERQQALIGVDGVIQTLERDLELLRTKPAPPADSRSMKSGLDHA